MDNLHGLPLLSMDWTAGNLPETFRKFKRHCETVLAGPLIDQDEEVKVNYLKLFLGDEGQDIIDGFNLSAEEIKKLDLLDEASTICPTEVKLSRSQSSVS